MAAALLLLAGCVAPLAQAWERDRDRNRDRDRDRDVRVTQRRYWRQEDPGDRERCRRVRICRPIRVRESECRRDRVCRTRDVCRRVNENGYIVTRCRPETICTVREVCRPVYRTAERCFTRVICR